MITPIAIKDGMATVHKNQVDYSFWRNQIEGLSMKQLQSALIMIMGCNASVEQALRVVRKHPD